MKKINKKKMKFNSKGKEKKKKMPIGKKILIIVLSLIILFIVSMALFMIFIAVSAGKFDPNKLVSQDQSVVYDSDGKYAIEFDFWAENVTIEFDVKK